MTESPPSYASAFDWLATLLAVVRIDGVVLFANSALEDVMSISRHNIQGTQLSEYFAEPAAFTNALKGANSNAFATMRYDAYLCRPAQDDLPVHVIVAPTERSGEVLVELLPLEQQARHERE